MLSSSTPIFEDEDNRGASLLKLTYDPGEVNEDKPDVLPGVGALKYEWCAGISEVYGWDDAVDEMDACCDRCW